MHTCPSWYPEFFEQRSTLLSIEPVSNSLSECGQTAVGPKQWSQDIKLVVSKMLAESHGMIIHLINITALTWKGRILFANNPSNFKECCVCVCVCVCVCTTSSLSIHLLMDTNVASMSWLLLIVLL